MDPPPGMGLKKSTPAQALTTPTTCNPTTIASDKELSVDNIGHWISNTEGILQQGGQVQRSARPERLAPITYHDEAMLAIYTMFNGELRDSPFGAPRRSSPWSAQLGKH